MRNAGHYLPHSTLSALLAKGNIARKHVEEFAKRRYFEDEKEIR